MATILDTLKKGTEYLEKYGIEDSRLNMEHLIAHTLRCDRMQLYLDFDRPLDEATLDILRGLTKRRSKGEPLQHLVGTVEFCGLELKTDRRALIPRPETEELVEKLAARKWSSPLRILDMGCGTAAIGLGLAKLLDSAQPEVTFADVSADALDLAKENAANLFGDNAPFTFIESDLFSNLDGPFDLIAANLPYIPKGEAPTLSREVQRDPPEALYGGDTGLEIMFRFLEDVASYLSGGGTLAMEFGIGQAEELRVFAEDSGLDHVEIQKDLSGTGRFLFASKAN